VAQRHITRAFEDAGFLGGSDMSILRGRPFWILVISAIALNAGPKVLANSSSPTMVVFSVSGSNTPKFATWSGSAWSSASSMSSVGANPNWVVLRNCPTRNEMACGTFDASNDVNVMFYNGSAWGSVTEVNTEGDETDDRNFDIAYEQSSGDALIVYYDDYEENFGYRTYNGSTLSSESDLSRSELDGNDYVALFPKPNSDQIIMITLGQVDDDGEVISANVWNGSSWLGWTTVETSATSNDDECFAFAYETNSGDGLLVYGENGQSTPRYRTLSGTTWGSENSLPSTGSAPKWVTLASDPASDKIMFGGLDNSNDINVNVWSGSSWGTNYEHESSAPATDRRGFDIAYEAGGTEALLVYVESSENKLQYRTWNGSSWSSEQDGTDLGALGRTVQLRTGTAAGEIFIGATDDGSDVELMRWTGSSMSSKTQIEGSVGGTSITESFMIAPPTGQSLVPANIPYAIDFEGTIGAEWSSSLVTSNATLSKFLGRFGESESVTLALNTTIGESYVVKFDMYAIDSWNGSETSSGPDYFDVSVDGTVLFHQTFDNRPTTQAYSYPYPSDQQGNYGFDSGYDDGAFRVVAVNFTASAAVTNIKFASLDLQELDDESWGIDNVTVQTAKFVDVSSAKSFNVATTTGGWGSGIHWADLDNDGDLDAILTGSSSSRLMKYNYGSGVFTASTFGGGSAYRQAALLDFDNDGDIDFWGMTHYDNEKLYLNDGAASFTDAGNKGNGSPSNNEAIAGADVNADGWCDVVNFSENSNWIGHHQGSALTLVGTSDSSYGLSVFGDYGNGDYCSSGDFNNDNRLDFFYHYSSGKLFLSDGDGTYTRNNYTISVTTGENDKFGSAWGDYDNDGDLDLFCARFGEGYSGTLWRNDRNWSTGSGNFTNVTSSAGLNINTSINYTNYKPGTRSCCWGDYDNDGDLDLFILGPNGNSYLYQNQGSGTFSRVAAGTGDYGAGHDACFVDYDNDGDLDLSITREDANAVLLQNRTNNTSYLKVRVIGRGAGGTNMAAVGTRVELWNSAGTTRLARRDIGVARGYGGTEPLWAHFGGVTPSTTYKVKVYLASRSVSDPYTVDVVPNATSTTIGGTTIPQMLTVTEPSKVKVIQWTEWLNKAP
jgi:hypothetical protein